MGASRKDLFSKSAFIIGIILIILAVIVYFAELRKISFFSLFGAVFLICLGVGLGITALKFYQNYAMLFFGTFFIQIGLFMLLFVLNIMPYHISIARSWPMLSVFVGTSLIPLSFFHSGKPRIRYLLPAIGFIIMGFVLLLFSTGIIDFSLRRFVIQWWFLIVVITGLLLILTAVAMNSKGNDKSKT
ncbi:MAG: DUF5668 domain-containing protein [Spirochaetaceae bacterium]|jgi:hypothetical protein|nr:DUF5668 domain-containing protein [Spirochaetaceae bacterium]